MCMYCRLSLSLLSLLTHHFRLSLIWFGLVWLYFELTACSGILYRTINNGPHFFVSARTQIDGKTKLMAINDSSMQMNGRNIEHKARSCIFSMSPFCQHTHTHIYKCIHTYWLRAGHTRSHWESYTMEASALAHTHFIKHLSWRNFAHSLCASIGFGCSSWIRIYIRTHYGLCYILIPVSCSLACFSNGSLRWWPKCRYFATHTFG